MNYDECLLLMLAGHSNVDSRTDILDTIPVRDEEFCHLYFTDLKLYLRCHSQLVDCYERHGVLVGLANVQ
ncbi:hypothetical protein IFM46972_06355 [Aspergillus udagawae]|uniref:Uncharacterized protein n=1 Tax=Aspergillus udagawae TaxID=91492 RepID=A0A8H3S2L1_9EURO|nr:hypothetical protein IFM46972_06355 [Aspergillus udagawae]